MIMGVPSSHIAQLEDRLLMEEVSLASALSLHSVADAESAQRLLQLSLLALEGKLRGSLEVGPTPYPDSYFLILDMNGLLLEKRPSSNGRDRLYTLRKDVGEFLEFCVKSLCGNTKIGLSKIIKEICKMALDFFYFFVKNLKLKIIVGTTGTTLEKIMLRRKEVFQSSSEFGFRKIFGSSDPDRNPCETIRAMMARPGTNLEGGSWITRMGRE